MSDQHDTVLPAAVRKQVEQADAIIARMNEEAGEAPEGIESEDTPEGAEAAPEPKQEPKKEAKDTDWQHKYSVLQGKYDAEVPRLTSDLRESQQTVRSLEDKLRKLETTVATMQEVNSPKKEPITENLITQDEIDQFGPDLIDLVNRVAKQAVAPYVDKKFNEVSKSVKQVGESVASTQESVAKSAREKLFDRLDSAVEGWREINRDQAFVGWLNQVDEFSGEPRGVLLRAAFERNDADRVIKFFKGFQKENAVDDASDQQADAPERKQESQQSLDKLVAPGQPKTGTTGAQEGSGKGRIWTRKQISDFYTEKNEFIKAHPNRDIPKRLAQLEEDLFAAQRENRIRN